jgi:hypothetical protein
MIPSLVHGPMFAAPICQMLPPNLSKLVGRHFTSARSRPQSVMSIKNQIRADAGATSRVGVEHDAVNGLMNRFDWRFLKLR